MVRSRRSAVQIELLHRALAEILQGGSVEVVMAKAQEAAGDGF